MWYCEQSSNSTVNVFSYWSLPHLHSWWRKACNVMWTIWMSLREPCTSCSNILTYWYIIILTVTQSYSCGRWKVYIPVLLYDHCTVRAVVFRITHYTCKKKENLKCEMITSGIEWNCLHVDMSKSVFQVVRGVLQVVFQAIFQVVELSCLALRRMALWKHLKELQQKHSKFAV